MYGNGTVGARDDSQRIAQWAAEAIKLDAHHIPARKLDAVPEAETVGPIVMDMDITRTPVRLELEMMVLYISEAVAHLRLAGPDLL